MSTTHLLKIFNQLPQNIFIFHHNTNILKTLLRDYLVKNAFYPIEEFLSPDHGSQLATNILFFFFFFFFFIIYLFIYLFYLTDQPRGLVVSL
jgi:hypothetical protein